jgi:hypothetical protein
MPHLWAFIDESKQKKYTMVATVLAESELVLARRMMRTLLKSGQSRIHFKNESPQRRREILSSISSLKHSNFVATSQLPKNMDARNECLARLISALHKQKVKRVILESDDSIVRSERKFLRELVTRQPELQALTYEHLHPRQEPCLWIPDAVAWSLQRGGDWRRRVLANCAWL